MKDSSISGKTLPRNLCSLKGKNMKRGVSAPSSGRLQRLQLAPNLKSCLDLGFLACFYHSCLHPVHNHSGRRLQHIVLFLPLACFLNQSLQLAQNLKCCFRILRFYHFLTPCKNTLTSYLHSFLVGKNLILYWFLLSTRFEFEYY